MLTIVHFILSLCPVFVVNVKNGPFYIFSSYPSDTKHVIDRESGKEVQLLFIVFIYLFYICTIKTTGCFCCWVRSMWHLFYGNNVLFLCSFWGYILYLLSRLMFCVNQLCIVTVCGSSQHVHSILYGL